MDRDRSFSPLAEYPVSTQVNENWANKRITEMTIEEIQKIKGNFSLNDSLDKQNIQQ